MVNYASLGHIATWTLVLGCCFMVIESNMHHTSHTLRNVHNCPETANLAMVQINAHFKENYTLKSQQNCQYLGPKQEFIRMDVTLEKVDDSTIKECQGLRVWLRQYKEHPINVTSYGTCAPASSDPSTTTSASASATASTTAVPTTIVG